MKTDFSQYVLYPPKHDLHTENLAYYGGSPILPKEARKTTFPNTTKEDIIQMIKSVSQTPSSIIDEFEKKYKKYVGAEYALSTASGTSSLHLALISVGVNPGDEVIVPAFTFIATAQAIVAAKAIPIFVDVNPRTFCIDTEKIEEKITPKTSVIMPVHVHGLPADLLEIQKICDKYQLKLVEDASHAHSAKVGNKMCGSIGDAAGQSLMADKNFPVGGEGGIVFFKKEEYFRRAKDFLETTQIDYQMSWIAAAFGISQLDRLGYYDKIRQRNANILIDELKKTRLFSPPFIPINSTHSFNMFRFHINVNLEEFNGIENFKIKEAIQTLLNEEGIFAREWQNRVLPHHLPFINKIGFGNNYPFTLNTNNNIDYLNQKFPIAENMINTTLVLCRELRSPIEYEKLLHYVQVFKKIDSNINKVVELSNKINVKKPFEKDARLG